MHEFCQNYKLHSFVKKMMGRFGLYNFHVYKHSFFLLFICQGKKNMNTYSLKVPVSGSSVITSCNASTQMLTMPQNLSWITLITENKASLLMLISPSLLTSSVHFHWKKKMGQCYFAFTLLVTQQSLIMLSTQFSRGNNFFTLYAFHMGKIHSNSILQ